MPCGGIYPSFEFVNLFQTECFCCNTPLGDEEHLMVVEWDALIHKRCLREFLQSPEAEVIREHQHPIVVGDDGGDGYVRLLCYSPELGMSDWAQCAVDAEGNEEVLGSWSRWEYSDEPRR